MTNIDKEIKSLEHKFEKSINEELLVALADLGCLMKKTELRYFLLDFFSEEYPFINYYKEVVDNLYESRVEDLPEVWLELIDQIVKKAEDFHKKLTENNTENPNELRAIQDFCQKICVNEVVSNLKSQYESIQKEYKLEDHKAVVRDVIEVIIKSLLSILIPIYERYLNDYEFQIQLVAEIKRPFFVQNRYTRCTMFDQKARTNISFMKESKETDKSGIWRQADVMNVDSATLDRLSKSVIDTSSNNNFSFIEQ